VKRHSKIDLILSLVATISITSFIFKIRNYDLVAVLISPLAFIGIYGLIRFIRTVYIIYKLDKDFLEFLSILLSFESNGLHINDLFKQAARQEIILPGIYSNIAKEYVVVEKLMGNSRRALSLLANNLPGSKLTEFIEGYIGIMDTTGNTLEYTKTTIDMELNSLENSMGTLLTIIEGFYEAYLIILLSVIILSSLPNPIDIGFIVKYILVIIGLGGYLVANFLSQKLYYDEPLFFTVFTTIFICALWILIDYFGILRTSLISAGIILASIILWRKTFYWKKKVESNIHSLLEDLYIEAEQGFTIDRALMRLSKRNNAYSWVAEELSNMLSLGIKGSRIASLINVTIFVRKALSLILAPLEISANHSKHLGYLLRLFRRITGIRKNVRERTRILFAYTLVLPPTIYTISYALKTMAPFGLTGVNPLDLLGYVLVSSISASLIVSKISDGCGLYDLKTLLIILENLILYLWISL